MDELTFDAQWNSSPATQALIRKSAHAVEYAERIHDVYFPDYEMPE